MISLEPADKALMTALDIRLRANYEINNHDLSLLIRSAKYGELKFVESRTVLDAYVGYLGAVRVSAETLSMAAGMQSMPSRLEEWGEGRLLLVYDISAASGWDSIVREEVFAEMRQERLIAVFRRNRLRLYLRRKGRFERIHIDRESRDPNARA